MTGAVDVVSRAEPGAVRRASHGTTRRASRWRVALVLAGLLAVYPAALLGYVYWHTLSSGLPGARHGPQDAYRHTLASAVLAYTISPRAVHWVTLVMEPGNDAGSRMDRHNNAIGAAIGASAESFAALRPEVLARVQAGRVHASDPDQVTWLPPHRWRELPI
jgi:hypothetical protein